MTLKSESLDQNNEHLWDNYIHRHPKGSLYHHSRWKHIIEEGYGHRCYYLMALETSQGKLTDKPDKLIGVLPLIHIKSRLFGNNLISMPFVDSAGVIADNRGVEERLLHHAMILAREKGAGTVELRQREPLTTDRFDQIVFAKKHKVIMSLQLPSSSEDLWRSFKSKLRSQIRRPSKEGLYTAIGGAELIDDFYRVFSTNMRDLGSPVHSKRFIRSVAGHFSEQARIVIVYLRGRPLAASFMIEYKNGLENPWASALHDFSNLSPNMLLYWAMLEYGCGKGYEHFNFGRSTPGEGTYKFKEQWGAMPEPLYWYYLPVSREVKADDELVGTSRYGSLVSLWKLLPVYVTTVIGPLIRRNISL